MSLDVITPATVRKALRAVRYGSTLHESPLLGLDLVSLRLRTEDLADTRGARAWALGQCITDTVDAELRRARGRSPEASAAPLTAEAELADLQRDLWSGSAERLDWALVHWRYLSPTRQPVHKVSHALGVAERTLQHWVARGVDALTKALHRREIEATHRLETTAGGAAAEGVIVDEGAAPRGVVDLLGELQALAGRHRQTIRVSSAQLEAMARHPATELVAYRLGRIAEWSLPRYRLDSRFVQMSLLVDLGEESRSGRWEAREERFSDLRDALAAVGEPAVVLLGPPGSGKSTLLRRLELDLSHDALGPGDPAVAAPLTFFVSLNQFRPPVPGSPLPAPRDWLAERWAARYPQLPPLAELAAERKMVYLLDGLNELPHRSAEEYRARIALWKQFLVETVAPGSGHRAVIACRSLDYSAPLSTPELRVPQVQLEPLEDARVEDFLRRYSPGNAPVMWDQLRGTRVLGALRWPFFLRLLVEAAEATERWDGGLAALITTFVRRALVREVERGNPRFEPNGLIDGHDYERIASGRGWRNCYELPERGALFGRLSELAIGMQSAATLRESSQVRIGYAAALDLLDRCTGGKDADSSAVIRAGEELGVLDEDRAADELMFQHQLMQEYFAARKLAREPDMALVRQAWRAAEIRPSLGEVIDSLSPADALPPLPGSGWEETTLMAAAMAGDPAAFLADLAQANLALAGRAGAQAELRERIPARILDTLRWALVKRSHDPEADLRDRIVCGHAAGELGDPRFERRAGRDGEFLLPPLVVIPGGTYLIGSDDPLVIDDEVPFDQHAPQHSVALERFEMGQHLVTNAEWACFMAAGAYDDERWWDTEAARAWRSGEGTSEPFRQNSHYWRRRFADEPGLLQAMFASGQIGAETFEAWQALIALDEAAFEATLVERHPDLRFTEPLHWRDRRFNGPAQPIVGVCWYEARAYCRWLAAQSGLPFRLPTEVEWEAMARGPAGSVVDRELPRGNVLAAHVRATTPVGVFPASDTPFGATDASGNVTEWTSSAWGTRSTQADFGYPYAADDGREVPDLPSTARRVMRGGAWMSDPAMDEPWFRGNFLPSHRTNYYGFRVACRRLE